MRKFLLSVAIAGLMIGSAHAGTDTNWPNRWVKFGEISIYTYYYDNYDNVQKKPSTKMPNGNRTIRVLVDIPLPDGETRQVFDGVPAQNGYGTSEIVSYEFNCKKKKYRMTDITDFAENMASSAPIEGSSEDENVWTSISKIAPIFYNLACAG